jgi:hypothetical protein
VNDDEIEEAGSRDEEVAEAGIAVQREGQGGEVERAHSENPHF